MTAPRWPRLLLSLNAWPARHPGAAFSILVLMFALGSVFALRMPGERLAAARDTMLRIDAALPGFDAATVEKMVTQRLEDALATLAGLREMEARTLAGRAQLALRFTSARRRDAAADETRRRLQQLRPSLPAGMEAPVLTRVDRDPPPAVVYAVTAAEWSDDIARWVRDILVDPLRELPEVAGVTLEGLDQREILIQPDARRLAGLGLAFDDVMQALRGEERAPPSRSTRHGVVIPSGAEAIASRAVRLPSGEPITLAEIARVVAVPRANVERPRHAEAAALRATVYARAPQQAGHVAERARAHLAWLRANDVVPPDVAVHVLHDAAQAAKEWRMQVLGHGGVAVAILLVVVFVAFGRRVSAFAAIAFAVWLSVSIAALWRLGFTLDLPTAVSVILVCLPFAAMLVLPGSTAAVVTVLGVAGASWAASVGLGSGRSGSAAFAVMLLLGVLVRWLMAPWLRAGDRAIRPRLASVLPSRRPASSAAAMLVPVYLGVIAAAHTLSGVHADQGILRLRLRGDDFSQVVSAARALLPALHAIGHVEAVASSARGEETWRLHLDPERMTQVGLGLAEVGRAFAVATDGLVVGESVSAEQKLPLRLQLPPGAAGESFERLLLRGERDKRPAVYLHQVGLVERIAEPRERLRVNRKPAVEITARWRGEEARAELEAFCRQFEVPTGYQAECAVIDAPY